MQEVLKEIDVGSLVHTLSSTEYPFI